MGLQVDLAPTPALPISGRPQDVNIIAEIPGTTNPDEIIVLEAGEIAERGTHGKLLKQDGLYAAMWNRQLEASEAEKRLREAHEMDDLGVVVKRAPAQPAE